MAYTLQQILGYVSLASMIEAIKNGIPNTLPKPFFDIEERVVGNAFRYIATTGVRTTSKLSQFGAPPVRRALTKLGSIDAVVLSSNEELALDPTTLSMLRDYNTPFLQDLGRKEVARETRNFIQRFVNLRVAATGLVLANGRLGFNGNGDLLPDSGYSGATEQVAFQVPAGNQGQLDVLGTGNIITAPWDLADTDIPEQVRVLKASSLKLNGYEVENILYGVDVVSYLINNDYVIDYLSREGAMRGEYLRNGELPARLFDCSWAPAYKMFFEDSNGTNQTIFDADKVVFYPTVTDQWWTLFLGSQPVPRSIDLAPDAMSALDNCEMAYGMFGYARLGIAPIQLLITFGDNFFPCLKLNNAIYQADVQFAA